MKLRYLAAFVLAFDALTKAWLTTPVWAEHRRDGTWAVSAVFALALPAAMLLYRPLRVAAVLLACGLLGNLLSALHGDVANPFVVQHAAAQAAFNVADVSLLAGMVAILVASPLIVRDGTRLLHRQRAQIATRRTA